MGDNNNLRMHAYLIVGSNQKAIDEKVHLIVKKTKSVPFEFPIAKIEDTRELGKYLKLSINTKTAIYIKNIDESTTEALNAFLKNLEEPQKNVSYILTARNVYGVIPTILSRCQLIRAGSPSTDANKKIAKSFLALPLPEKLLELSNIKARDEAIFYMQNLISSLHPLLIEEKNRLRITKIISGAEETLKALNANGNVALQLANFAINI